MSKKSMFFLIYMLIFICSKGEFSDVDPLSFEENRYADIDENENDLKESKILEDTQEEDSGVITVERLEEIIENANNSPMPQSSVEIEEEEFQRIEFTNVNNTPAVFQSIEKTLDKYEFSNKSEDSYGGRITTSELTSDKFVENFELGVGVTYENTEEDDYTTRQLMTHTPVYATGRYNISKDDEKTKYVKINLGYAITEEDIREDLNELSRNQSGVYYGVGGGVEYRDVTLDLMYQVNKDAYEKNQSSKDDSRVTFTVDYKLGN